MKTPHKHAELIKAWADGAEIEARQVDRNLWLAVQEPNWSIHAVYRIKPEPKPDVVQCWYTSPNDWFYQHSPKNNLRLTFDGETGKLKAAEVIA